MADGVSMDITDHGLTPLAEAPLRVAAFNIQVFGVKKSNQKDVTAILLKIISRYDLILIQEVRDRTQTAIDKLVMSLNQLDPEDPFTCEESERLGRTNSKEQYVFLYRCRRLRVVDTYQYDDGLDDGTDVFQREPFAVRFASPTTDLQDFAVIAIHTDPDDAVKEIGALHKVYDVTKRHWDLEDILIAGDFNADEGYVDQDDWCKIRLKTDRRFKWLIDDETDTTVGNTDRAYDRFVTVGKRLKASVVPGSVGVYRFDDDLQLSKEDAEDVSDHYPIELQLLGKVNSSIQRNTSTEVCVVIKQRHPEPSLDAALNVSRAARDEQVCAGFSTQVLERDSAVHEVRAVRCGVADVVGSLQEFQSRFPGVLTDDTLSMTSAYMASPVMTSQPTIYGLGQEAPGTGVLANGDGSMFDVTVVVGLQEPCWCHVLVSRHVS